MSVRKRQWITSKGEPREAWVIDYTDRQGDRHIETFARKKDADTRYAEVNVDVRAGVHIAASKSITVEEAAEIWIEVSQLDGLERATIQQYRGHIDNHIVPALGRVKLSDLTVAGVEAFATDLRKAGASKSYGAEDNSLSRISDCCRPQAWSCFPKRGPRHRTQADQGRDTAQAED